MLAVRWWGRDDVRVEDITDPGDPPAGWVRLKIQACGICGTDVEEYTSGPVIIPTDPHSLTGRCAPLTLGHEAVGVVDTKGAGVRLDLGTPVAIESNLFCGTCWWCRRGQYQLCPGLASLGLMGDGGLAEYMLAPEYMCIPFQNEVPSEHAALAEPLSVAVRAVSRAGLGIGSTVAVLGAGTVGLLAIQAARLAGASTVISVERLPERRALALKLGADLAVPPEDAIKAAEGATRGIGVDATIEAAGNANAAAFAVKLVRRGGRAVLLGVFDDTVPVDMMDLLLGEKTLTASLSHVYDEDFTHAVSLIDRGAVMLEPLITDRIALPDVLEKGFKPLVTEPGEHLKIVVFPNGQAV
jgi:(R,R)-butanediol dehydrogenase/meso-butanediol dehydrogenase/diacetyl reductase